MNHYDQPSTKEKRKMREKEKKLKETVNRAYSSELRKDVEKFVEEKHKPGSGEIHTYIKENHLPEKWIPEEIDIDNVASKIFDRVRRKSKEEARPASGKGIPEGKFIRKRTMIWYEYEKVDLE